MRRGIVILDCVLFIAAAALALAGLSSCATQPVEPALSGQDLRAMTDKMAMEIMACPAVQAEMQRKGKLRVVVEPVENCLTAEVLPRGPADAYTARVRALLAQQAPDQFIWVMNRDAFYALRQAELDVPLGPAPGSIDPEYALTAIFSSVASEDANHRQTSYVCTYQLTDLHSRVVLWSGKYEVSKVAVKGFLD